MTDEQPAKDDLLIEAADLRMQSEAILSRVAEAKIPILVELNKWKEWAKAENQEAARLHEAALNLERLADELYPDPNAQHVNIAWQ